MGDQIILRTALHQPAKATAHVAGGYYYVDLRDDTGQIGITAFRCSSCGEVIDPVIPGNRLDPTPDLLRGAKERKYA